MAYKKGIEDLPLREINKSLKAIVLVYNLLDNDELVTEKEIDYGNFEDRKWLGRITFWALTNHCTVETIALIDAKAETKEN